VIIPAGYAQVNVHFTGDNLPTGAQVTFGVDDNGALTATQIAEIVENALIVGDMMSRLVDDMVISNLHVKKGPNETGPFVDYALNIPGESTANGVSPNVSFLVTKNTSQGGRKGAGRMFWPGLTEAGIGSDGLMDVTVRANLQAHFDTFLSTLVGDSLPMVLLHGDATAPYNVDSLTVAAVGATQRRRIRR